MEENSVQLQNVTKIYRQGNNPMVALDHLYLSIPRGELLAITGKSNSGKSTL